LRKTLVFLPGCNNDAFLAVEVCELFHLRDVEVFKESEAKKFGVLVGAVSLPDEVL
jgi:hypothetical protein